MENDLSNAGEKDGPSQQGSASTCVAHSLGKCISAAGEEHQPRIDFLQADAINACVKLGGGEEVINNGSMPDRPIWKSDHVLLQEGGVSPGAQGGSPSFKAKFTRIEKCKPEGYDKKKQHVLVIRIPNQTMKHCLYVHGKDVTHWLCWDSYGHTEEGMKIKRIEITKPGNQLYQVEVEIQEVHKFELLNISTTGPAGTMWSDLMGKYRLVTASNKSSPFDHHSWKMEGKEHLLVVPDHNRWVIRQNNQQEKIGNQTMPAPLLPVGLPSLNWMYSDDSDNTWKPDIQLKVEVLESVGTQETLHNQMSASNNSMKMGQEDVVDAQTEEDKVTEMKNIIVKRCNKICSNEPHFEEIFAEDMGGEDMRRDYANWKNLPGNMMKLPKLKIKYILEVLWIGTLENDVTAKQIYEKIEQLAKNNKYYNGIKGELKSVL